MGGFDWSSLFRDCIVAYHESITKFFLSCHDELMMVFNFGFFFRPVRERFEIKSKRHNIIFLL